MKNVRLKDIAIINPKNNEDFENEFYYIDLGCVKNGKADFGEKINNLGKPSRAQRILNDNDILFQTVRPYQRNNLLYKKVNNNQVVCSTGYAQLRTYQNVDYNYLYQLLSTDKFNFLVSLRCTGTNYPAINSNDLADIQIGFHTEITKQKQIGNLLSTMDKLIEDKEQLVKELKSKFDYYISYLTGDIESNTKFKYIQLGDIVKNVSSKSIIENEYPLLTSSKSGIYLQNDYFNGDIVTKTNIGNKIIKKGQMTYRSMSDTGTFTFNVLSDIEIGLVSPAYPVMEIIEYDPKLIGLLMNNSMYFKKQILSSNEGSTRTALPYSRLKDFKIKIHEDIDRQQKYFELVSSMDKIIDLHKQELEQLKLKKKYYLNKIFDKKR